MSLIVNNNSSAFSVWSSYSVNTMKMRHAMRLLSVGELGVADSPAGVGISERMRSKARQVSSARANVENGISMLQTADSWTQKVNDIVGRMSELSIEAQDGTKAVQDIANLEIEFDELSAEITSITSSSANFNGVSLLDSTGDINIQVGPESAETMALSRSNLKLNVADKLASLAGAASGVQASGVTDALAGIIDTVSAARAQNGAQQTRLEHTRSGLLAYEDNIRAAESKIRDVDMARVSTDLAKYDILSQVSSAMMTQANNLSGQVLNLFAS